MASRKAKEQQAATGSNSLDEIKDLLNSKFSEPSTRLTSLEDKLNNVTKDIHLKLNAVETKVQEASTCAQENREDIEGLKFRLAELNETVSNQVIIINQLDVEVEDLENRSLRKTLVFRNIKKQQSEKIWDDTKMVFANEISKICKISQRKKSSDTLNQPIGSPLPTQTPLPNQHHLFLLPKLQTGTCRKKLNLPLLKRTRKVSRQYLSHRCAPSL